MSKNYKFKNPEGIYFVSFAIVHWIDIFIRQEYFNIIVDSLNFSVKNKGMTIYAWCIMPSHVHLVYKSENNKPSELLREIKSFTAKELISAIKIMLKKVEKNGYSMLLRLNNLIILMVELIKYGKQKVIQLNYIPMN